MALKDNAPTQQGDEHDEHGGEHHGGGSKKKLIVLIGAVVVVLSLAAGGYFFFMAGGDKKHAEEEQSEETHAEASGHEEGKEEGHGEGHGGKEGEAIPSVVFYDLPDFVVNLSDPGSKTRFLKMSVTLELPDAATLEKVKQMEPRVMDSFQVYLRELRKSDLEGSAGLYRLREELLLRVNKTVYPAKVNDILFKELITQ